MFKQVLESVSGFQIWSVISLLLFFGSFIFATIYTFKFDKSLTDYLSRLPLDEENQNINRS